MCFVMISLFNNLFWDAVNPPLMVNTWFGAESQIVVRFVHRNAASEIDTPRFNAGMHGVGFYLTGWHEYPA